MGRTVVIEATRKSDHLHYDYFIDNKCAGNRDLLELDDNATNADPSVNAFEKEWGARCEGHGLCTPQVHMVVEAQIVGATESGHLGIGAIGRPMARISKVTYADFEQDR